MEDAGNMKSAARLVLSVSLVASIGFGLSACNHQTLSSGSNALTVSVVRSPSGAGRYNRGPFDINKLQVLPVDPAAAAIFGNESVQLRFGALVDVDLVTTDPTPFSQVALSEGTYRVTHFIITHPALVDNDQAPPPYARCIDGVPAINVSDVAQVPPVPNQVDFADEPSLMFTVRPGQTTLSIKINVPGFIAGYEAAFACQEGCGAGGTTNCLQPPFDEAAFRAAVLANITIE
jgi:hypothetical protein